jgi:hypothetical protein
VSTHNTQVASLAPAAVTPDHGAVVRSLQARLNGKGGSTGFRMRLHDRYGGREIDTAGDGMFALFDGAARALECAWRIRDNAEQQSLGVRIGVHVLHAYLPPRL